MEENLWTWEWYIVGGVIALILISKVTGVWDVIKSIAGTFKKVFEVISVALLDWVIFLTKLIWKAHLVFFKNLFTPRKKLLPTEEFERVNRRGGA